MFFEVKEVIDDKIGRTIVNGDNIAYINDLDDIDPERKGHPKLANSVIIYISKEITLCKESLAELATFLYGEDRKKK